MKLTATLYWRAGRDCGWFVRVNGRTFSGPHSLSEAWDKAVAINRKRVPSWIRCPGQ